MDGRILLVGAVFLLLCRIFFSCLFCWGSLFVLSSLSIPLPGKAGKTKSTEPARMS